MINCRTPSSGQQQERHAGEKHRAQRRLPRHAHALHHRVGEVGVQPHAGRERDGVAREAAHQETADRGRKAGGGGHRGQRHAGLVQDRRVDEDDVRHRHERGEAGQDFGPPIGAKRLEFEVPLQPETQGHHAILSGAGNLALHRDFGGSSGLPSRPVWPVRGSRERRCPELPAVSSCGAR